MEGCFSESSVDHTVAWCLIRNGTFLKCSKGCGTWDGYLKSLMMPEVKSLLSCNSFESWAKSHWAEWFTRVCRGSFQLYWEMHQWHEKLNASWAHTDPWCSHLGHLEEILRFWSESCQFSTNPGRWRSIFLFALSFPRLLDLWHVLLCKQRRWITTQNGLMSTAR